MNGKIDESKLITIFEKSNLSFLIAEDTASGLNMLKRAIEEDF